MDTSPANRHPDLSPETGTLGSWALEAEMSGAACLVTGLLKLGKPGLGPLRLGADTGQVFSRVGRSLRYVAMVPILLPSGWARSVRVLGVCLHWLAGEGASVDAPQAAPAPGSITGCVTAVVSAGRFLPITTALGSDASPPCLLGKHTLLPPRRAGE